MRIRSALRAPLLLAAFFAASIAHYAAGAENFACGAGGRPNPKSARCDCPSGKIERTVGGTSRCVERPATATAPTGNGRPKVTAPPTATDTVTMPTPPPPPAPLVTCPAGKMATAEGCVELCAADEVWSATGCVSRCAPDELWSGGRCERTARPAQRPKCADDQVADAAGHCCWPGQSWGEESRRCRGAPRCPSTHRADGETCVLAECAPGQQRVSDGQHCCWEGQEWSRASHRCVGIPECPEGYDLRGDACVPWRRCAAPEVAIDRAHCCLPGQRWGVREDGSSGCAGAPRCRSGWVARGETCVSAEKAEADDELESKSTLLGARMFGIGFQYDYLVLPTVGALPSGNAAVGTTTGHVFGYAMQYHFANLPIMLRGSLSVGVYTRHGTVTQPDPSTGSPVTTDETSAGTLYMCAIGAAFAPLSLPSAATSSSSWLNPFVGLDFYGIKYHASSSSSGTSSNGALLPAPSDGTGLFLSLGDTLSIIDDKKSTGAVRGGLSLTVSYGLQVLTKTDDRIASRLSITGMYSAF